MFGGSARQRRPALATKKGTLKVWAAAAGIALLAGGCGSQTSADDLRALLTRLREPTSGAVLVDGRDVREIDVEDWRAQIAAAFQDFTRYALPAHENIAALQSYHNSGGMILRPPGPSDETIPGDDVRVYDVLGRRGEEILPGYKYMITGKDLYEVFGGSKDWMYRTCGIFGMTNELFTPFNFFRKTGHEGYFGSEEVRARHLLVGLLDVSHGESA